ncbi:MAG: ABC transporter ATP-binding protein [Anaerolineales bacterium]|nr:ABC transporter ATP-binding protein [Anaerolineales bacterium]
MPAIQMLGITKRFDPVLANDHVDFSLEPGEIHALLGENGAGKTTLMRILYGLYHADEGEILVDGQLAHITSPKEAITLGIGMVAQHFTLVPSLSVAENVVLGYTRGLGFDPLAAQQNVAEAAARFGIKTDPAALVRHLSVGERQRIEILKALYRNARVLIMDEPTSVLVPQEVNVLFETLERLRAAGLSVIFISHKLNEVMAVCDRITVLRQGRVVGTVDKTETSQAELACMMVGRETFGVVRHGEHPQGQVRLRLDHLNALDNKGLPALKQVSLEVQAGEILCIAGVSGNGQAELARVLAGTLKPAEGRILVEDQDLTGSDPSRFLAAGVGRIPEERHEGTIGELSVAENMVLERLDDFTRNGLLDRNLIRRHGEQLIAEYQIKAQPTDRMRTLSGGNIQKVVLARALSGKPRFLVASQPTRGLDVGATEYVRSKLLEQRDQGVAVLLISEDLDEVLALADRIAVIYEGRIVGVIPTQEASLEQLGLMMSGACPQGAARGGNS